MVVTLIGVSLIGLMTGLLINYLADVLPLTRRIGRPICVECGRPLGWRNFLLFRPCPVCSTPRSLRSYLVPIAAMVAYAAAWIWQSGRIPFWLAAIVLAYFGLVVIIDLEHRLILHPVSLVGLILGLGFGVYVNGIVKTLLGGAAGFIIMLALYYLGELFARWLAKRRGQTLDEVALGFGDVNLTAVLGLMLGWPAVLAGIVVAILLAGLVSMIYLVYLLITRRYRLFTAIPYAPFLVIGTVILLSFIR
jgi:leader peptidase (prepilin peptidase)/N-methyltransferase